jgi:hypothetical protein
MGRLSSVDVGEQRLCSKLTLSAASRSHSWDIVAKLAPARPLFQAPVRNVFRPERFVGKHDRGSETRRLMRQTDH